MGEDLGDGLRIGENRSEAELAEGKRDKGETRAADGADQREGLWKEAEALRVAQAWQEATGHHTRHPPLFSVQG